MSYYGGSGKKNYSLLTVIVSAFLGGLVALLLFQVFNKGTSQYTIGPASGPTQSSTVVQSDITKAAQKVLPAVVGVVNLSQSDDGLGLGPKKESIGSGVIFEKKNGKAMIITNHHVVAGPQQSGTGSQQLHVMLPSGKKVKATLLGSDEYSDIAVLEIPSAGVDAVAQLGNSDVLKVGEPAIAIGNPLGLEFSRSVTAGVISSPKREVEVKEGLSGDFIQTDASINPGNSGGPLVNIAGEVIGINTVKVSAQGVEGMGFSNPINNVIKIVNQLMKQGKVMHPFLGVGMDDLSNYPEEYWRPKLHLPNEVSSGVYVNKVYPGSGAFKAGIQPGDVIVAIDDKQVEKISQLRSYIFTSKKIGDKMKIAYYREGQKKTTTAELSKDPSK